MNNERGSFEDFVNFEANIQLSKDEFEKAVEGGLRNCDWARAHHKARRTLFTPMKVAKGPRKVDEVGRVRVTLMENRIDEKVKTIQLKVDDWRSQENSHERSETFTRWTMFLDKGQIPAACKTWLQPWGGKRICPIKPPE